MKITTKLRRLQFFTGFRHLSLVISKDTLSQYLQPTETVESAGLESPHYPVWLNTGQRCHLLPALILAWQLGWGHHKINLKIGQND